MDKKFETFTYSELIEEFRTVVQKTEVEIQAIKEKTEVMKKDLVLEMGKRKELEGIEKKKIAAVITADLKELVSGTYIRNILSGVGQTDPRFASATEKKKLREKAQQEEKKILVAAGMGSQELEPPTEEYESPVITNQHEDTADLHSLITNDNEIIDQRPESEKVQDETNDAEEDIDKIHLIRSLKVENNNLIQQISDLEKLVEENKALRETIAELEKENTKLFNRNKELEEENNKLKQENRALRNPPKVEQTAAIPSMFSSKTHDEYLQSKRQNIIKGTKK